MRIFYFALAFYIAALALIDAVSYDGHYRRAVWQEANYQASRGYAEVRYMLDKIGI